MIDFIPDIDAGSALCGYMIKLAFDAEWFESIFDIISCVTADKSGSHNLGTVDGCRF